RSIRPDGAGRRIGKALAVTEPGARLMANRGVTNRKERRKMQKLLRGRLTSEAGFTLMELLIVVMIVGILAAAAVALYLGYVRDSRLAEAKGLAGSVLTAAQACAQQNTPTEGTNCAPASLAQKIGVDSASGNTPDTKRKVAVPTTVTVNADFPPSVGRVTAI